LGAKIKNDLVFDKIKRKINATLGTNSPKKNSDGSDTSDWYVSAGRYGVGVYGTLTYGV
jgi:hypothetical protein